MDMEQIRQMLGQDYPSYIGYAATNAQLPYAVIRPLATDPADVAVAGTVYAWDNDLSLYCCGGSVEASYNLSKDAVRKLAGQRYGGSTLVARIGYVGAAVEGHYESQVTIETTQGVI